MSTTYFLAFCPFFGSHSLRYTSVHGGWSGFSGDGAPELQHALSDLVVPALRRRKFTMDEQVIRFGSQIRLYIVHAVHVPAVMLSGGGFAPLSKHLRAHCNAGDFSTSPEMTEHALSRLDW